MKKILGWSLLTVVYLLVLGQGCSALKGQPQKISFKIPHIQTELKSPLVAVKRKVIPKKEIKAITKKSNKLKRKDSAKALAKSSYPKPIRKSYEIKNYEVVKEEKAPEERVEEVESNYSGDGVLNNDYPIKHYGFEYNPTVQTIAWSDFYKGAIEDTLARIAREEESSRDDGALAKEADEVKVAQAAPENKKAYSPSDPKMLAMFEKPEINIGQIHEGNIHKEESKNDEEELVLIDYSENENIHDVANISLSSEVRKVIEREMDSQVMGSLNGATPLASAPSQGWKDIIKNKLSGAAPSDDQNQYSNRVTLYALEANLNKGFGGDVRNFSFIPSYSDAKVYEDFNEGLVNFDYSLKNNSGVLRGTISKNYFMRTTFEIPLGSEYSKFEVPMITQESMIDYLEEEKLDGFGGYYLVDMGEMIADVEIEKANFKGLPYQHRILLNDEFKKTKDHVRYILFIGVDPGNVNIRYLGINGQESSKITFIAPDELTYDFSQLVRPSEITISTYLRNTLGRSRKPLTLSPESIINFATGEHPLQKVPGEYEVETPWMIKGDRTYLEVAHLEDSIFVGIDGDKKLTLPSKEFIGEVLRAFSISGLNQECLLQLNLESDVKEMHVFGEGPRGPTVYDTAYLDTEGVFTAELSPISEKLFILGNEEGIFNIRVEYTDGTEDLLRTYCSPSTYLLEQL